VSTQVINPITYLLYRSSDWGLNPGPVAVQASTVTIQYEGRLKWLYTVTKNTGKNIKFGQQKPKILQK